MCPSCVHRVAIGRLRVCIGSILAFYQIPDENRAKLKISYSCGHRVSKPARYDATLTENVWYFVLFYLSRATSWTRRSFYASDVKIELHIRSDELLQVSNGMHFSRNQKKLNSLALLFGVNNLLLHI